MSFNVRHNPGQQFNLNLPKKKQRCEIGKSEKTTLCDLTEKTMTKRDRSGKAGVPHSQSENPKNARGGKRKK